VSDKYRYKQSEDYRGVNFDAAEKARDARYRNPHSIAFTNIPKYHRVDNKAGILNAISNLATSNPFGANPNAQRSRKYVSTAGMSKDALQTLYGNIIPPAPYLRKYDQYFDPSQNLFEGGIGRMIDDIKDSRTMDILKFLLKY
tara:strand:+ start:79 stop:507 length:429 start_codon:yes stop_codon:yes gene_type:complete